MQGTVKPSPRNFRLMVIGQVISILGSALLRFALSLYVLDITGRADLFATLFAISNIPLLLSPVGGAIADRFNRRNLMVIFDFTSSAVVFGFFFLLPLAINHSVLLIGAAMVLLSIISAMYFPTVTASVPLLVEESNLGRANGAVQAVQALSNVAAPVLGGILYEHMGVWTLVIISGSAFFLSAVMEVFICIPFEKREQQGHIVTTIAKDMKEGFLYVMKHSFILKAMILAALLNLLLSPYFIVGAPLVFKTAMNSSETLYGIGMGIIQAGTILGALMMGFFAKRIRVSNIHRWLFVVAILLLPMSLAVTPFALKLGFYPAYILFILCAMPVSLILTVMSIFVITSVQKITSNENLGKVMAIILCVAQCAAPLGQMIYGFIFEGFSGLVFLPTVLVSAAIFVVAIGTRKILKNEEDV